MCVFTYPTPAGRQEYLRARMSKGRFRVARDQHAQRCRGGHVSSRSQGDVKHALNAIGIPLIAPLYHSFSQTNHLSKTEL